MSRLRSAPTTDMPIDLEDRSRGPLRGPDASGTTDPSQGGALGGVLGAAGGLGGVPGHDTELGGILGAASGLGGAFSVISPDEKVRRGIEKNRQAAVAEGDDASRSGLIQGLGNTYQNIQGGPGETLADTT